MTALCVDGLALPPSAPEAEQVGERQAAEAEGADLQEVAAGDAVAEAVPGSAGDGEHGGNLCRASGWVRGGGSEVECSSGGGAKQGRKYSTTRHPVTARDL